MSPKSETLSVGIIGGSGVYDMPGLRLGEPFSHTTSYGEAQLRKGELTSSATCLEIAFLARHGRDHSVPPHRVNYRANVAALKEFGVQMVVATGAVGSLREDLPPGRLVLLDQFLDFTRSRVSTFFDEVGEVRHTDMTEPYDEGVRAHLLRAADKAEVHLRPRGTYVCTEGPRFETAAEVAMYGQLGGDVVGMTNVPEVVLARELDLAYAAVALVTNLGAGISDSPLTHDEVLQAMEENSKQLGSLLAAFFEEVASDNLKGETG
ncbi:MAG: S-methyl-5'-thioadenosine phosphorylase [Bacillota bacterium]